MQIYNDVMFFLTRFLGLKYGKWKGLVCAVKKAVNEKLRYHSFAQKPNKARKNLER